MKKLIALSSAAILALAFAAPVAADKGGVPNDNACKGQMVNAIAPGQLVKDGAKPSVKAIMAIIALRCD